MINLENAVKFPFEDKDWLKTVGVYFLISLGLAIITFVLQTTFQLPADIFNTIAKETETESFKYLATSTNAISAFFNMIVSLVTFPVTLYLSGYLFDVVGHIMYGKKPEITPHGNIWQRVKFGIVKVVIGFVLGMTSLLLLGFPILTGAAAAISMESMIVVSILLWIATGVLFLLWLFTCVIIVKFAMYSMEYLYLSEGFKNVFVLSKVSALISNNWKKYLLLLGLEILGAIAISLSFVTCCMAFFVYPAVATVVAFALAYCYGTVYKEIYTSSRV
ncbi:MAG: hypothetical protein UT34_C0001G0315 [candidate division WS6 bacterium GW2011_GWF2_39_15]|uniref:Uncharacterized protein n=1 Tax=candidate division WS6 bacterium GW2011_GWF2_39_15 TaxID=1619100 RepID=A0A0G0Q773_9BACT|nr:MAG: hypothetical protein UT34_C0001G0315 [candidate division WS6 bacterium GW2011_GWF2_39_15]